MSDSPALGVSSPPPAPPLPPARPQSDISKDSGFILKVRSAPPDWFYQAPNPPPLINHHAAPTGLYFFYGTLQDPCMLTEILGLDAKLNLRPGYITGYSAKLWGQYPALIDGPPGNIIEGMVFDVQTVKQGARLAEYETQAYSVKPCFIKYTDGKEPATAYGNVFMFVGDERELSEGEFDLKLWLQRMGRE
ncbi:hypothetical protein CPC735_001550 [Coccidioides posadasii C735 delta SOWgp]|uniref:Putative gamma-glutamylcyclotransferase n=1 Tax=Coccidioides posadasii (strain C735) TaxID=222929 RepID=C5PE77_COCP7|nr:hypothetical protein CPC735_001550 [Coccidioides posadasii C735 delta SOWgp]EER24810.1 hypothetical protein CPC735_001550 [Coccidioides posadasii C735 delta SOWgp]|eukprot:XP_003066955.1 hypothetical protein CPC735_001550 [Coccidioides posadasii C735 delta SOWgp]